MEQKMITIPFEVEKAKRIQAGEEPGKIITRDGRNVRVVCWDRQEDTYPIIALLWNKERSNETCRTYMDNGCLFENGEENQYDLTLQVPEWTKYKDGDVLACEERIKQTINMKKKEFAVGETFQFGLKKLKVVEDENDFKSACKDCYMQEMCDNFLVSNINIAIGPCEDFGRSDGKCVHFVEVFDDGTGEC